jgi:hypothetical protein
MGPFYQEWGLFYQEWGIFIRNGAFLSGMGPFPVPEHGDKSQSLKLRISKQWIIFNEEALIAVS